MDAPSPIPSSTPPSRCACSALSTSWKKCRRTAGNCRSTCSRWKNRWLHWVWNKLPRVHPATTGRTKVPRRGPMRARGRFQQPAMTSSSKAIAACALLILVCIGTLSYWSEVRNDQDREWVTHTLHVVEKLQTLRIDITQCETGQRGYMLTGQDRYLELYEAGVAEVRQDLKELPDLTADNPREQRAIRQLNPLIASRLAELNDGIWVRKESGLLAGVEAATRANNGEKWMGQIAAQIGEMRDTEAGLLSSRLETAAASTRKIKVVIALGNALAILILLVK